MQRAIAPAPRPRLPRLVLAAGGVALGLGLAAMLPGEGFGAVARFFDTHVVQAFHDLELARFLCL